MEPYREGDQIFKRLSRRFGTNAEIRDIDTVSTFFQLLLEETGGAVIIDFLDASCWDRFCGYEFDHKKGYLFLYWYGCEDVTDPSLSLRSTPTSLHGLVLHFQSLMILNANAYPLFALQGYAMTEKEIKKVLGPGSTSLETFKYNYFSLRVLRQVNEVNQKYLCLNTPMYSALILPKTTNFEAAASESFLFNLNLIVARSKLESIQKELATIPQQETDLICEKSSTIRRTLESVLKI